MWGTLLFVTAVGILNVILAICFPLTPIFNAFLGGVCFGMAVVMLLVQISDRLS